MRLSIGEARRSCRQVAGEPHCGRMRRLSKLQRPRHDVVKVVQGLPW